MGAFEFTALDSKGRQRSGVLEADTPRQIRQHLREQGWSPLSVQEVQAREQRSRSRRSVFSRGISATDLALVTRQFSTLVQSGLPVEEALQALSRQTEKQRLKSMLMAVRSRVMEGHTLAAGLRDFPHVFSDLYCATVAAGEQSGYLHVVLDRLADYTENRQVLRQKTILAMIYPLIVIGVSLLVLAALMVYVVPEIVSVFEGIGQELPLLTRSLIALSDFTRENGIYVFLVALGLVIVVRTLLRHPATLHRFHGMQLKLPVISKLVKGLNTSRFARTLSILTASGVPVLEALRISASVLENLPMRSAVEQTAMRVREGTALHKALEQSGYFPPMTLHLIASGEASGKLEEMLGRAADSQEREMEVLISTMTELFGPLLILIMGFMVLTIVIAILLPIFDLNQLVK